MSTPRSSNWSGIWDRIGARPESSAPLGAFRILFGLLVAGELLWYWLARPFMEVFYFDTSFHFAYPGLPQLPFVSGLPMQIFVGLLIVAFLLLAVGFAYQVMKWVCCLGFAYLFFLERAAFLNHWYLTLLIGVLLLWIPAHVRFSVDVSFGWVRQQNTVSAWMRGSIITLVGIVYLMSGLAKLNPDWLSGRTMDLTLQSVSGGIDHFPEPGGREIIGAWAVMLLELLAWPMLLYRRLRIPMLILLLAFHVANLSLFTIGFFPLQMIVLSLLFVPGWWPRGRMGTAPLTLSPRRYPRLRILWLAFFVLQLLLPLRHYLQPGNTLWTEDARLFSWDMFLAFKGGEVQYEISQPLNGGLRAPVDLNREGLTWGQQNKIFKSPDMILQCAHYIARRYTKPGGQGVQVYAKMTRLGLNGRPQQAFVQPNIDLAEQPRRFWSAYPWVIPMQEQNSQP